MPETSKSPKFPSNEKIPSNVKTNQTSLLKKVVPMATFTIALALAGSPEDVKAETGNNKGITIELATALQDNNVFQYRTESGDEKTDNIRPIWEMSIDYIWQNFYINWQAAKDFNIERVWEKEYSIEYPLDSDKILKFVVKCNYSSTSITFDKDVKAYIVFKRSGDTIKYDETKWLSQFDKIDLKVNGDVKEKQVTMYWDKIYFKVNNAIYIYEKWETNGSISDFTLTEKLIPIDINNIKNEWELWHDIWINNNTYVNHLSIKENPYKNEDLIKNAIANVSINYTDPFKSNYPELWNFQLNRLNRPDLWKEVYKDGDYYYRELYYKDGWDYIKIMNVYFDKTGKIDIEKTNNSMEDSDLFKKWECGINENWEFFITDAYVETLVQQLIIDRGVLINMINTDKVVSTEDFPGLKKEIMGDIWAPNPKIISYNAITKKFGISINNQEKLPCKVNDGTVIIVDETGKPTNNDFYYNFWKTYYRVSIKDWKLSVEIIDKPGENPRKTLPNYLGDPVVKSILNSDWVLTSINANNIIYFDKNTWKLIGEIPWKKEDGVRKVLDDYSVNLNFLDLYNDESFEAQRKTIQDLCKELGIVDIDIRNIFRKKLENNGIDFNLKDIRIVQPWSKYWRYYKIDNNFKITIDDKLYNSAEKCFEEILSRLEYIKRINDCKILRVHWKEVKDFQEFIWLESKDYESEEAVLKFVEWENDEVKVKIRRWNWQEAIVNYSVIWNVFRSWFTWEGKTYFSDQWYKLSTDDEWNIIFTVIAWKKDK